MLDGIQHSTGFLNNHILIQKKFAILKIKWGLDTKIRYVTNSFNKLNIICSKIKI